jgi:carbonic anhydrase
MKKILLAVSAAVLLCSTTIYAEEQQDGNHTTMHQAHWDYDTHGPSCWGDFAQECQKGHLQSPINIDTHKSFALNGSLALKMNEDVHTTAEVVDNGHAIQVNVKNGGKLVLDGREYILMQFHFHGHSEHTIDGKQYALEGHLVHKSADGNLAVIAVMFNEGKNNPVLDNVLGGIGRVIRIDPQDLLPQDKKHYYHYVGSLTTPPCSEGVQWYILKQTASASKDQIMDMRKYYNKNFRTPQPIYNRKLEAK